MTRRRLLAPSLTATAGAASGIDGACTGSRVAAFVLLASAIAAAWQGVRVIQRLNADERGEQRAAIGEGDA